MGWDPNEETSDGNGLLMLLAGQIDQKFSAILMLLNLLLEILLLKKIIGIPSPNPLHLALHALPWDMRSCRGHQEFMGTTREVLERNAMKFNVMYIGVS